MRYPNPRCKLVKVPEPREMVFVHIEGIDQFGDKWSCTLEKITMKTVRRNFGFPPAQAETYKNLQTWVDHLGAALYNPVWWRYHKTPLPARHTRYPHRIGHYEILHGCHRLRALERLDFPYIYVYMHRGRTYWNPSNPNWTAEVQKKLTVNVKEPITYTLHGICEKCGAGVRWGTNRTKGEGGADQFKSTEYTCKNCGCEGIRPEIYPEPV